MISLRKALHKVAPVHSGLAYLSASSVFLCLPKKMSGSQGRGAMVSVGHVSPGE